MAALSTSTMNYTTGAKPALVAAAAADTADCPSKEGEVFVVYENTNASTRTITVVVPNNTDWGLANTDQSFTLAANTGVLWIPLHPAYANASNKVDLQCTPAVLNVTVGVVRIN